MATHNESTLTAYDRLLEIVRLLLEPADARGVAQNVASAICEATGYERAVITTIEPSTGQIVGRAGHGVDLADVAQVREHPDDIPVFEQVAASDCPVVIPRDEIRRAIPPKYADLFSVRGTLVASPLRSERLGLMGVIFTDCAGGVFQPSSVEQKLLEHFSNLAALIFQNSILLEKSQELTRILERQRIGTDLHDGVTQKLFTAQLLLQELREDTSLPDNALDTVGMLATRLSEAGSQLRQALLELTRTGDDSPEAAAPLHHWIRHHLDEFVQESGISVDIEPRGSGREPTGRSREVLLRTLREGLANVAKHANATEVLVVVRSGLTWITVEVHDDGDGDELNVRAVLNRRDGLSFGLLSLAKDAERLGGRLWISSAPQLGGLALSVSVPVSGALHDTGILD